MKNIPLITSLPTQGIAVTGLIKPTTEIVNLNPRNLKGSKIIVSGKIYSGLDKKEPVRNAKVEVWHADDFGTYHIEEHNKDISYYSTNKPILRGFILTDENGEYAFSSIRPGLFGDRARHFHYRISAPGYRTLETQIYFKNDPRILIDDIAMVADPCRVVDFKKEQNSSYRGIVNIYLPKIDH
ncbi:dioxygenase family protein [Aquimarina rhabdastrellae]